MNASSLIDRISPKQSPRILPQFQSDVRTDDIQRLPHENDRVITIEEDSSQKLQPFDRIEEPEQTAEKLRIHGPSYKAVCDAMRPYSPAYRTLLTAGAGTGTYFLRAHAHADVVDRTMSTIMVTCSFAYSVSSHLPLVVYCGLKSMAMVADGAVAGGRVARRLPAQIAHLADALKTKEV